jgi:ketosteroid isomerase-like protein
MSNLNIIQGTYAAFAKGDVPGVLGVMDADISWTEAEGFPYGGTYHGPNAVLEGVFMRLGTEWLCSANTAEHTRPRARAFRRTSRTSGSFATGKSSGLRSTRIRCSCTGPCRHKLIPAGR